MAATLAGCEPTGSESDMRLEAARGVIQQEIIQRPNGPTIPVPAGTELFVRLDRQLGVEESRAGDRFTATVSRPVVMGDRVLIPSGAQVRGIVTAVQEPGEGRGDVAIIRLQIRRISIAQDEHPLRASIVDVDPKWVSGGASEGAVPRVDSDSVGTESAPGIEPAGRGILARAPVDPAGTAIVLGTRSSIAVLPEGSVMKLRLDAPLRLPAEPAAVA